MVLRLVVCIAITFACGSDAKHLMASNAPHAHMQRAIDSTLRIRITTSHSLAHCFGVAVGKYVAYSAAHCFTDSVYIEIKSKINTHQGFLVSVNGKRDLALLTVKGGFDSWVKPIDRYTREQYCYRIHAQLERGVCYGPHETTFGSSFIIIPGQSGSGVFNVHEELLGIGCRVGGPRQFSLLP